MTDDPPSSGPRAAAEALFRTFVAKHRRDPAIDPHAFAVDVDPAVRHAFLEIVEDFLALQEGRASESSGAWMGSPTGGATLGDFRLRREIGRGGMGVVWEAEQISLGRPVALKVLYPHLGLSTRWIDRFHQEAQAGGRLSHSGIVQVLAVGEAEGSHFIAQELVAGGTTLGDWIQQLSEGEEFPSGHFQEVARRFARIADALAAAHAEGVVHRDIKPGNILLDGDQPKIADFGLALIEEEPALSRTGEMLGTAYYMSPEQVSGRRERIGPCSDVFSLGATLYECLCLRLPFPGDTRAQVADKILHEDPPGPRRIRSRVPRDLAVICMKCLAKNPARRYPSMTALTADLERWLANQPILARPPGRAARMAKWCRRHPAVAAAGAVATVSLGLLAALFVDAKRGWRQADAAAEKARTQQRTAESIEQFLVGLFAAVGPDGSAGIDTPAGDLLTRGIEQLRQDLHEEPVVRAAMLMTLGQVYAGLGVNPQAEALLREALALHEQHIGELDQRTLKAMNQLAHLLVGRARYDEAETLYRRAQRGHEALYGRESPQALENQGNLAFLLWRVGRLDEAEPLLVNSLEGTRLLHGDDHFHTWTARNNLAALLLGRGKAEQARPLLEQIVAVRRRDNGADAGATLSALSLLAEATKKCGDLDGAEDLLEESLAGHQRTYGGDHPKTANVWFDLGRLHHQRGDWATAEQDFRACEQIRAQRLRVGHPARLAVMANLVTVLKRQQKWREAHDWADRLLQATPADDPRLAERQHEVAQLGARLEG